MILKLYINPTYNTPDKADGGIRRVIEAMVKYLPDHNIEIVATVEEADILNYHAGSYTEYNNKPMVASCHGLYWSNYKWDDHYHNASRAVIEVMARAQAVTAPSKWVRGAIARGILHNPHTIYHGVDIEEWAPAARNPKNDAYVLWNKARSDIISNPADLMKIAGLMPKTKFVSTIGKPTNNLQIVGVVPYPKMKEHIKNAAVYLATARETMGIGTLEALASGIPVAGWDFGGQSEIIKQGITGYLAPYGDYKALKECIQRCIAERPTLSRNARADAVNRWQWKDKIKQYADLFWDTYNQWSRPGPKYTVIIPAYNLAHYLPQAVDSVLNQTAGDWEAVIIDDCSTDNTRSIVDTYTDPRISYIKTAQNSGLCNVRNLGYKVANGRYILYLDADDMIAPNALKVLGDYLDSDPGAHIAYGRIDFMDHNGENPKKGDTPRPYNWEYQIAHIHQFPIGGSLIRRESLQRSGGFRVRDWRAEDAAWISRVTSFGIRAKKATEDPILIYRIHSESKSVREAKANPHDIDGNWLSWLGWHMAPNRKDGQQAIRIGQRPPRYLVPFGAQHPPGDLKHWNIDHHQDPLVSIIIPVGPGHEYHLIDALDSLTAQTVAYWEAVVINDTGRPLDTSYAPWAKVINTEGEKGAGHARNLGVSIAAAPLVYFLDSDDWLLSGGLDHMVRAWIDQGSSKYIYSSYIDLAQNGKTKIQPMRDYIQTEWRAQHAVNILINKADFLAVGGFDENLKGWEDWDLPLKLAISGYCGHYIPDQTFIYRTYTGKRREWAVREENQTKLLAILDQRYGPYYKRGLKMAKCCGGGSGAQNILRARASYGDMKAAAALSSFSTGQPQPQIVQSVRMRFIGSNTGSETFIRIGGKMLTKTYKGANSQTFRFTNAHPADVVLLESSGKWRRVTRAAPQVPKIRAPRPPAANIDIGPRIHVAPMMTARTAEQTAVSSSPANGSTNPPLITAAAQKLATKRGINIYTLKGTGKNGKITIGDVRGSR